MVSVQSREIEDDDFGPPVPPGLGELSGAQQSLADFLRIDPDLIMTATQSNSISAVKHLTDLRDLAVLKGDSNHFAVRLAEFRDLRFRKSSLIARLDAAGLI